MGALDPEGPWGDVAAGEPLTFGAIMLERLCPAVGGALALDALDDVPLPDEAFDWAQVPPEARERAGEVLALVDRGCGALLDVELRTAARRLLALAAARDPQVLGRGRVDTTAAAICWIAAEANDVFDETDLTVKQLVDWFGVSPNTPSAARQVAGSSDRRRCRSVRLRRSGPRLPRLPDRGAAGRDHRRTGPVPGIAAERRR